MSIDQMTLLEKRVHQVLDQMKRLKQENALLEQKVRTISQQLAKRERDVFRWNHDRERLQSRVKRILSEMETWPVRPDSTGATEARSRKRGET